VNPFRRSRWRALGARLAIALVTSSLATTVALGVERRTVDTTVEGIDRAAGVDEEVLTERGDDPAEPANYLIVGSDSRSDLERSEDQAAPGGQRSDTIMVAHVDPITKMSVLLSFPRDLVVDIPGKGSSKINAAFNADAGGGPELLILTLKQNFGIDITNYFEVDFAGFKQIVDTIGRVKIYFPAPAYDRYTGLEVPYYGCAALDGDAALRYVRSRHYFYYDFDAAEWREDPTSDFGRIRRQQYFIRSLMQQALDRTLRRPYEAKTIVDRLANMLTVDETVNTDDVKKLITAFIDSDPAAVEMLTVPVQSDGRGGLLLRDDEAQPMFDRLSLQPLTVAVIDFSKFQVDVLNAGGDDGAAQLAMGELARLGFARGTVGDAPEVDRTELRYSTPNGRAAAEFVKLFVLGGAEIVEDPSLDTTADVVLAIGPDFEGINDAAPTTTTTGDEVAETTATTIAPNPGQEPEGQPRGSQFVGCG
jgi:LCP family protein required for cell wall assembly